MLVIVSLRRLDNDRIVVGVARPQHDSNPTHNYPSEKACAAFYPMRLRSNRVVVHAILLILLLAASAFAQSSTGDPLDLNISAHRAKDWDTSPNGGMNANLNPLNSLSPLLSCGDSTHAISWNPITKKFGCQALTVGSGDGSIKVTDYGVTCDGVTDDTTAAQNAANVACNATYLGGRKLIAPPNCRIAVSSTVALNNCSGIHLDFGSAQGETTANTSGFIWIGASGGGPVVSLNKTRDFVLENFFILQGKTGGNQANVALDLDENSGSGIITHGRVSDVSIGFGARGTVANPNFRAIRLGLKAPGNVEDIEFDRLRIQCPGPAPTSTTSNGIGFIAAAGSGAEPFNTVLWNNNITNCSHAYDFENTLCCVSIDNGLMGQNYTDLYVTNGSEIHYQHIRSESGTAQIVINAHNVVLEHLLFAGLTAGTTTINLTSTGNIKLDDLEWNNVAVTPVIAPGAGYLDWQHSKVPDGKCPDMSSTGLNPQQGFSYMNQSFSGSCTNQRKGTITTVN
jgi:hypothetical protein